MNNFTIEELVILTKELINEKLEEDKYGFVSEDEFNIPYPLKNKINKLETIEYNKLMDNLYLIVDEYLKDYTGELNSLNILSELIYNNYKNIL